MSSKKIALKFTAKAFYSIENGWLKVVNLDKNNQKWISFVDIGELFRKCEKCEELNPCKCKLKLMKSEMIIVKNDLVKDPLHFAIPILNALQTIMKENLYGNNFYFESRASFFEGEHIFATFSIIENEVLRYSIYPFSYRPMTPKKLEDESNSKEVMKLLLALNKLDAKKFNYDIVTLIALDKIKKDRDSNALMLKCCFSWAESRSENKNKKYFDHILQIPPPFIRKK